MKVFVACRHSMFEHFKNFPWLLIRENQLHTLLSMWLLGRGNQIHNIEYKYIWWNSTYWWFLHDETLLHLRCCAIITDLKVALKWLLLFNIKDFITFLWNSIKWWDVLSVALCIFIYLPRNITVKRTTTEQKRQQTWRWRDNFDYDLVTAVMQ